MSITLNDIAERVGVTPTTVSMVLNGRGNPIRVSERTRQKVLQAAKELNYVPSLTARALVKGKTNTLGLILGDIHTPFFSEMAAIALHEAEARKYHLLISVTEWDEAKELNCLEMLLQRGVDGMLVGVGALRPGVQLYEHLLQKIFPMVMFQSTPEMASVCNDWHEGMAQGVGYLKEKGHTRIGFVGLGMGYHHKGDKWRIFSKACLKVGVESVYYEGATINLDVFQDVAGRVARDPSRPTALIVFSDYLATGVIQGLKKENLRVPEDIAVMGMDGTRMGQYFNPPLTTIAQDLNRQVVEGMNIVMNLIDNPELPREEVVFPTRLIIRESA